MRTILTKVFWCVFGCSVPSWIIWISEPGAGSKVLHCDTFLRADSSSSPVMTAIMGVPPLFLSFLSVSCPTEKLRRDPEKRNETEALDHDATSDPDGVLDHRPDWFAILEACKRGIARYCIPEKDPKWLPSDGQVKTDVESTQHTDPGVIIWVDKDLNDQFYGDFYQRELRQVCRVSFLPYLRGNDGRSSIITKLFLSEWIVPRDQFSLVSICCRRSGGHD